MEESIKRLVREKLEWENRARQLEKKIRTTDDVIKIANEKEDDSEFLQQIGEFTNQFVHDLSTLLSKISSLINIIEMSFKNKTIENDPEKIDDLISENKKRLESIHRQLRGLSYLNKKYVQGFDKVNLNEVISENIEMIRLHYEKCSIEVNMSDEPIVIQADRESLNQIVSNLVINAVEASDPDKINITVTAKQTEGQIELTVTDTGIGIYEREKDKIFNLHYTTKKTGFGIGLHLVKKAVELHRGQIQVESNPGVGTTFTVILPVNQESNDGNNT
ncbi:MAG: HAMP domain-containing histidine kinase [Nitrospirae bacterium]|nr:HAMP domain-containing histidine kinase [Nitrospirota bacterium]